MMMILLVVVVVMVVLVVVVVLLLLPTMVKTMMMMMMTMMMMMMIMITMKIKVMMMILMEQPRILDLMMYSSKHVTWRFDKEVVVKQANEDQLEKAELEPELDWLPLGLDSSLIHLHYFQILHLMPAYFPQIPFAEMNYFQLGDNCSFDHYDQIPSDSALGLPLNEKVKLKAQHLNLASFVHSREFANAPYFDLIFDNHWDYHWHRCCIHLDHHVKKKFDPEVLPLTSLTANC